MSESGSENEEETGLMNKGELDNTGIQITKDFNSIASLINPDFSGDSQSRITKLEANHFYLWFFYFAALIAYSVVTGVVSSLGKGRAFILQIGVITPPSPGTGDAYQDAFTVQDHSLSPLPPTVLVCALAGVYMVYHGAYGFVYREKTRMYVMERSNPARWVAMAVARSLEMIVLFSLNGERQITAILLIASTSIGVCTIACGLDMAVKNCYMQCGIETKKKVSTKGTNLLKPLNCWKEVVTLGQILVLIAAVLATAFFLRVGYNGQNTPTWVLGLSIAIPVVSFLSVLWYVWNTWNTVCDCKLQEYHFVRGDWKINTFNMVMFIILSVVLFAEQAQM